MKLVIFSLIALVKASWDDASLPFDDIVRNHGFQVDEHDVHTDDGYTLKIFRILGGGSPMYIQHGIFDSSDSFIVNDEKSPAILAAKKGYDVWLGNNRGNKYCLKHDSLSPDEKEFWDFSW